MTTFQFTFSQPVLQLLVVQIHIAPYAYMHAIDSYFKYIKYQLNIYIFDYEVDTIERYAICVY